MQQQVVIEEVKLGQENYPVCCIESLIEDFIRYAESTGKAPATIYAHKTSLRYWKRYLAEKKISDLSAVTPQTLSGYQAWIYNYQTRFKRPFTLQSQIGILNNLQVFYQYLEKSGKILGNPAAVIHLPKGPKKLPSVILSPLEMKRLLAQPDTASVLGFRDRTMYEVLYSTGIRIGELIQLNVKDVNFADGLLTIRGGKGGKDRVVPIGETACGYLKEYIAEIRLKFRQAAKTDTAFFNKQGRAMHKSGLGKKLHIYSLRAGIKKRVTVHTFRHTLATEMLKHGADIRQIQEMLGHGNLRTTQIYTHVVKGELKRVQAECHPREQTELPENFVNYRGRKYLTNDDRREAAHLRKNPERNET